MVVVGVVVKRVERDEEGRGVKWRKVVSSVLM